MPRIASSVGIVSATSLLLTCKSTAALLEDDGFWKNMIVCRFGASAKAAARTKEPRRLYLSLYYADFARCDELSLDFWMYCDGQMIWCYQAVGLAPLHPEDYAERHALIFKTPLLWAFWYSSEEKLIEVMKAVKPEERVWSAGTINELAVPEDRRAVIRSAIIKYLGEDDDYCSGLLDDLDLPDIFVKGYSTLFSLARDLDVPEELYQPEVFPDNWLVMMDLQDKAEKVGMWVTCKKPDMGDMAKHLEKQGVDSFLYMYDTI